MKYWLQFHCCLDDIVDCKEFDNPDLEVRKSGVPVPEGVDAGDGLWAKKSVKKGFLLAFPGFWVHRCDLAELQEKGFYSFDLPFEELHTRTDAELLANGVWPEEARCSLAYATFPGCKANHVQSATYKSNNVAEVNCAMEVRVPMDPNWDPNKKTKREGKQGLVVLTATRDIKAGEELFSDYGPLFWTSGEDVTKKVARPLHAGRTPAYASLPTGLEEGSLQQKGLSTSPPLAR